MLLFEEARKKGINACADAIGKEFIENEAISFYSNAGCVEDENSVFCVFAVDDRPHDSYETDEDEDVADGDYRYMASCVVSMENGKITFLKCKLPNKE